MIHFDCVSKCYGERTIFKDFNFTFPEKGIVGIVGHSGSGKTTLLNIISGMDFNYDGNVKIGNTNLKLLSEKELCNFRVANIGYVFQNFSLFNLDTVFENVYLPLNSISSAPTRIKKRRVNEILKLLGIHKLRKKVINKLSGGEKQRVAIARALINNPKIVLCDEPTGALDENNGKLIFNLLEEISKTTLVVIATHDFSSIQNIANILINVSDNNIEITQFNKDVNKDSKLFLIDGTKHKNSSLPLGFKFRYAFQKNKSKKWRSLIMNVMLSLSLTGIGLSVIISDSVTSKINDAFSDILNGNQVIVTRKNPNQNVFTASYSAPYETIDEIATNYADEIDGIGATYLVNFEDFFKDENVFYFFTNNRKSIINSLSARSINDFKWLGENSSNVFYPYEPDDLSDDQVVIALSYEDMVNLCYQLQIQRNYTSLGHYVYEEGLSLVLNVRNNYWQYDDEQIFDVVSIMESSSSKIYHKNKLWNEYVFEELMRLPSDDDSTHYYPWEMEKIYYIKTYQDPADFINLISYDSAYDDYVFERTNYLYNPTICEPNIVCEEKRIFVYHVDKNGVEHSLIRKIDEEGKLNRYFFLSQFGYSSYASSIFSGFSKNVFVSNDDNLIDEAIDADTSLSQEENVSLNLPSGVVQGNYLNSLGEGLRFSTDFRKIIAGREPKNLNEIVISLGLANNLYPGVNPIGQYLNFASEISETSYNNRIEKEYGKTKLVIVGIVNENKNYIYHNPEWTISFFRDKLGISSFLLITTGLVIELNEKENAKNFCDELNSKFKEYEFTSPIAALNENISSTLEYANLILKSFSILSIVISSLLLATVTLLSIIESKDDIQLFRCLGYRNNDINSTFICQSLLQGLLAFLFSSLELVIVDQIISYFLGDYLNIGFKFSFNIKPLFIVLVIAIVLPIIIAKIMTMLINRTKNTVK